MARYVIRLATEVEAITFDELIEHGRANGGNIVNGMPWSFIYAGHPVTHETDTCYYVCTSAGPLKFTPSCMLVTEPSGRLRVIRTEDFHDRYAHVGA